MAARRRLVARVTRRSAVGGGLLLLSIVTGTLSDRPIVRAPIAIGGYQVLAGDFHVHPVLLSAWDLVLEARRRGIDVVGLTPHNELFSAMIGRSFSRLVGGPIVVVGAEERGSAYHLIALGIAHNVSPRQPAAAAIDEVHRQRGVAIAAHPVHGFWPAYDAEALAKLDGAEVMGPVAYRESTRANDLRSFYGRGHFAAIGSSDYHGLGALGYCRTYVFATANTDESVLDALRRHRTIVYDAEGRAYGDRELIALAERDGRLRQIDALRPTNSGTLTWISRLTGILALILKLTASPSI
jgi:predicted metal-dependent phosphoesterase TrpH